MVATVNFNVMRALLRDAPSLQKCTMQNGNPPTSPRDTTRPNERETHFGPTPGVRVYPTLGHLRKHNTAPYLEEVPIIRLSSAGISLHPKRSVCCSPALSHPPHNGVPPIKSTTLPMDSCQKKDFSRKPLLGPQQQRRARNPTAELEPESFD